MNPIARYFARHRARNRKHFETLRPRIIQENLRVLCNSAVVFEIFMVLYGLFAVFLFHNLVLSHLYFLFIIANIVVIVRAFLLRRQSSPSFYRVQALCILYLLLVMCFTTCLSIFPFPDRPAIFYSLAYCMVIMLFQIPRFQMAILLTVISGLYILLSYLFKSPSAFPYDLFSGLTTWLLGYYFIYVITDLHLRNGEVQMDLDVQGSTDALTGLPNRRGMDEFASLSYQRCTILRVPMGVIMVDIDHFKAYNDRFGHQAGDRCLMDLGHALTALSHNAGFFAARYGGEEFVILMPGCCWEEEAVCCAEYIQESLPLADPDGRPVTVSMGVAVEYPSPDRSFAGLLERADQALYQAKAQGRNRYVLASGTDGASTVGNDIALKSFDF